MWRPPSGGRLFFASGCRILRVVREGCGSFAEKSLLQSERDFDRLRVGGVF